MTRRSAFSAAFISAVMPLILSSCCGSSNGFIAASTHTPPGTLTIAGSLTAISGPTTITVTEPGYTGTFSAVSRNINVVTVAPASALGAKRRYTASASATTATFTVTPVAAGNTSVLISDSDGNSITVPASVAGAILEPQHNP
jgi:hypothetical protein